MLKRGAKYVGYVLLWLLIIVVVIWADGATREHRASTLISGISIEVEHSDDNTLIDGKAMEEWLAEQGISPVGLPIDKADISHIESTVLGHTAVAEADVYVTYDGEVAIEVLQHEPIARLRIDGYDTYVTADGCIMQATTGYSAPVTVVTGGYKPLFGSNFTGYVANIVKDSLAKLDAYITELEQQKIPYFEQHQTNNRELRVMLNERIRQGIFMGDEEYEILRADLKRRKSEARNRHRYRKQEIESGIVALERRQEEARQSKKALQREAEEFFAMVDFLRRVNTDNYWSAEIVQVMASGGNGRAIELSFVPRSGRFVVDLGSTADIDRKLATLLRFYEKGLNNVGWDKFRNISLRYHGQVVCK